MSVNSLMIPCIDSQYTHEYIANVFWNQRIAKVSSVTLLPFINSKEYNVAYISVDEWCDSEVSYNFIKRLNNTNVETRVIYNDDNWWTVYRCSEMRHCFTGKTITFNSSYFEKDAVEEEKYLLNKKSALTGKCLRSTSINSIDLSKACLMTFTRKKMQKRIC